MEVIMVIMLAVVIISNINIRTVIAMTTLYLVLVRKIMMLSILILIPLQLK